MKDFLEMIGLGGLFIGFSFFVAALATLFFIIITTAPIVIIIWVVHSLFF